MVAADARTAVTFSLSPGRICAVSAASVQPGPGHGPSLRGRRDTSTDSTSASRRPGVSLGRRQIYKRRNEIEPCSGGSRARVSSRASRNSRSSSASSTSHSSTMPCVSVNGPSPHFSPGSWSARRSPADRVGTACSASRGYARLRRDAGTSGKRRDARCRAESAALRVAPRRPPAASRASTVFPDTLFGPLLADRTVRDAGRDRGEKCGLASDQ